MTIEKNKRLWVQKDKIKSISWLINSIHRIENNLVILLLASILIFAITQVILRNFFDSGIVWGESLLRILVLWLGLAGAIVASRQGKQLNIDVLSQYIPDRYKSYVKQLNFLFTALVCLTISYYSFEFTYLEYTEGSYAFEQVPAWLSISIIPIAFAMMSIKYILQIISIKSDGFK